MRWGLFVKRQEGLQPLDLSLECKVSHHGCPPKCVAWLDAHSQMESHLIICCHFFFFFFVCLCSAGKGMQRGAGERVQCKCKCCAISWILLLLLQVLGLPASGLGTKQRQDQNQSQKFPFVGNFALILTLCWSWHGVRQISLDLIQVPLKLMSVLFSVPFPPTRPDFSGSSHSHLISLLPRHSLRNLDKHA